METMQHAVGNRQRQDQHNSQAQGPHSNVATNAQGVTICDSCQPRLYSANEPYTGNKEIKVGQLWLVGIGGSEPHSLPPTHIS